MFYCWVVSRGTGVDLQAELLTPDWLETTDTDLYTQALYAHWQVRPQQGRRAFDIFVFRRRLQLYSLAERDLP